MDKINKPLNATKLQAGTFDSQLIQQVCQRALKSNIIDQDQVEHLADALTCCHLEMMRLDLPKLLQSSLEELSHDVLGIIAHIDCKNSKLRSPFQPKSMTHLLASNIARKAKRWFTAKNAGVMARAKKRKRRAA